MLPCLGRGGDSNDLARAALKNEQVSDTDVVAWDGDGVGRAGALDVANVAARAVIHLDVYVYFLADWRDSVVMVMMGGVGMVVAVDGMGNTLGETVRCTRSTVAERVVMAVFVVIAHMRSWSVGTVDSVVLYADVFFVRRAVVTSLDELVSNEGLGVSTKVSFGDVDLSVVASGLVTNGAKFAVVGLVLAEVGFRVALVRFLVAKRRKRRQQLLQRNVGWEIARFCLSVSCLHRATLAPRSRQLRAISVASVSRA